MIADVLLALGLLLSTASQVRLAGLSVGPGEICLLIWVVLMLGRVLSRDGPPLTSALSRLLIFWSLFAVAQCLGTVAAVVIGDQHDTRWFLHDVMAFPLLAAVSCLSVVGPEAGPRLRRVAWLVAGIGTASLAVLLANGEGLVDLPLIDPWYWDRFRGWSAIPNQLALLCIVLALLSLHLAETAGRPGERLAALACMLLAAFVGRLTKSDACSVVLVIAGPMFLALKFRTWLSSSDQRLTLRSASAWIVLLALPLVLASAVPLGYSIATQAEGFAKEIFKDNGKVTEEEATLRFELWRQAISRGLELGMLGLGPGPHLAIPHSILVGRQDAADQPKNIEHPEPSLVPNFEAHNTLLDLFTQGGLIAVLSFIGIVGAALFTAYKARLAGLITLLCGATFFGMFHLIVRHPIFWFAVALCLVAKAGARRPAAVGAWSRPHRRDRLAARGLVSTT